MSLNLYFNDLCPKCRQPTMQAVIEPHPGDRYMAVQKNYCTECGPVKTKFISLKSMEPRHVHRVSGSHPSTSKNSTAGS